MSFNIKIPYVIATHIKKFAAASSLKDKSKAAALGFVGGQLMVSNGSSVTPVAGFPAVTSGLVAGPTALTAAQSGGIFLMDRAAGGEFTLPAPQAGLSYTFMVTVSVTSNDYEITTDVPGTTLYLGSVWETLANSTGGSQFNANGSTHSAIVMNGTTSGGLAGTVIQVQCINGTNWFVDGTVIASGTIVTPFAAS